MGNYVLPLGLLLGAIAGLAMMPGAEPAFRIAFVLGCAAVGLMMALATRIGVKRGP